MDAHPILFEEVNLYYDQKHKSHVLMCYGEKKIAGTCK